tara:strand:- start:4764 stop:4958 length:195 start_codon:yes stop_codon:yes gene_type:complete
MTKDKYKALVKRCIKKGIVSEITSTELPLQRLQVKNRVATKTKKQTDEISSEEMKSIFRELCPQ